METVRLQPHPATPSTAVESLTVAVRCDTQLHLTYELRGDLAALAIPPPATPGIADELWRHTCFEAFVAPEPGTAYYELNFSPSGQWASYAFASYRQRSSAVPLAPTMTWQRRDDALILTASVAHLTVAGAGAGTEARAPSTGTEARAPSAGTEARAPLRLGLTAVIEMRDGALSYWALQHPAARPDFHHADGFTLRLAAC